MIPSSEEQHRPPTGSREHLISTMSYSMFVLRTLGVPFRGYSFAERIRGVLLTGVFADHFPKGCDYLIHENPVGDLDVAWARSPEEWMALWAELHQAHNRRVLLAAFDRWCDIVAYPFERTFDLCRLLVSSTQSRALATGQLVKSGAAEMAGAVRTFGAKISFGLKLTGFGLLCVGSLAGFLWLAHRHYAKQSQVTRTIAIFERMQGEMAADDDIMEDERGEQPAPRGADGEPIEVPVHQRPEVSLPRRDYPRFACRCAFWCKANFDCRESSRTSAQVAVVREALQRELRRKNVRKAHIAAVLDLAVELAFVPTIAELEGLKLQNAVEVRRVRLEAIAARDHSYQLDFDWVLGWFGSRGAVSDTK